MATGFTKAELDTMAKSVMPDGWEKIPEELYARYLMLAQEQISMVQVTIANMAIQASRPGNRKVDPHASGCKAGLDRASMWIMGFRNASTPQDAAPLPEPVPATVKDNSPLPADIMTGEEALIAMFPFEKQDGSGVVSKAPEA